jgi:hypothetical protein
VFVHESMAGEANDDPVPLIGAGVTFAFSTSGDRIAFESFVSFVPVGTVVPGGVVVVVVVPPAPVVVDTMVVVLVVVLVVALSADAGREIKATERVETIPRTSAPRRYLEARVSPRRPVTWWTIRILVDSLSLLA